MIQTEKYIWYACYGSNILEDRFLCYIQGGQPKGSSKTYKGCKDKSHPVDKEEIYINSELYFAKKSKSWGNGGVCFIKTDFNPKQLTLAKMYLITREQFIDIVKQETNNEEELIINFDKAIREGSLVFKEGSWYGNLLHIGTQYEYPIFTFTNQGNITDINKPSENYLMTIISGIQETFDHLNTDEIVDYLITKKGIENNYSREDLTKLIKH